MSFAKLPLDFFVAPEDLLQGQACMLALYRDQLCPQQPNPPPDPGVIRVLDHGYREVPAGIWDVAAFGNQHLEWRVFNVTFSGAMLSQNQAQPGAVLLFAAFLEQTTIDIELCMDGHGPQQCPDDCQRRATLILRLGVRPS